MDRTLCLCLLLFTAAVAAATGGAEHNHTSGGLLWPTAAEESDPPPPTDDSDSDSDGGFSSLDGMLQWAISHSDPGKLKESAEAQQRLSASDLQKRQIEIKETLEKIKMPSDGELMKIAVRDLNNVSTSLEDRHRALQELLELVEPIDNANDLNKLGGLLAVTKELNHSDPGIRTVAAWVIGKASQNNPNVQQQILEFGVLSRLMKMVKSNSIEEANKALYAVSALIRNNLDSQELFYAEAGGWMLQDILSNASLDIRLRRKAVLLLADLAEYQLENVDRDEPPFFNDQDLLKSVVDLTASTDLDLQEKALVAIKSLLQLRTTKAWVFKDFCALGDALNRMRQLLHDLMVDEYQRDYVMDVESLRVEVEHIFHRKLVKQK
ncbi:nucleotide exchange factor SIL1 isoform X2 [Cajanus cajan]|uniref:Nucleotide exchange factor SIL1 n=1 Tax=Cajanus cajan TaxID=3821 RepID=A0A151QNX3_CAJCA|nr:nucleotide exchange factor SIL1 isoform X1 [Cajanus cajan]XP_020208640.1 nucleotide exchange factor SIL1 isoform X2 [Cajanus cajan]KYP31952.1 Nucleotide exchange factor SIL1 [Cajanus cajan]